MKRPHPFLTMHTPKKSEITFSFPEVAPACKKSVHSICSFLRYSQFWSTMTRLATPISDHAHPNIFDQLLIYVNLYQRVKNLIDLFWRYGWLKNPALWLAENILVNILGTKIFPGFEQEKANNINFHYRTNSVKINDKIFQ